MLSVRSQANAAALELAEDARRTLSRRVELARERASRAGHHVVASVTVSVPSDLDPTAMVLQARGADERFFCFERPDWGAFALAGLGEAAVVLPHGPDRFAEAAKRCRTLAQGALCQDPASDPGAPPGSGPVFFGGLSFAPDGGNTAPWQAFGPGRLVLPEVSLVRSGSEARLTATALVDGDDDTRGVVDRLATRVAALGPAQIAPLDVAEASQDAAGDGGDRYERAVAEAVERIKAGELSKVVLAREVEVRPSNGRDPGSVFAALRFLFPSCYCYLVGTGDAAFVGASPELLLRRDGSRCQTVALAGTTRRSSDPAVDSHLGERLLHSPKEREEQAIVAHRIERRLDPVSLWVAASDEPALVKVQNVQHLATPIRAQLAEPVSALELAGRLHPTPAVGGEPWDTAAAVIAALEGLDRGWYAGPVGWSDLSEDGEYCVALRCALIAGEVCRLYAGDGIVRDSVPAEELAETQAKLAALLPLVC